MKNKLGFLVGVLIAATITVMAAPPDRWIHVSVLSADSKGETVRINMPMSLAEKVLPTICVDKLNRGKVKVDDKFDEVDLRALFDAVRTTPDSEFVTVENRDESVRVAKSGGNLLIKVREKHGDRHRDNFSDKHHDNQTVDIKVPLTVVQALLSGKSDELDVLAGIRALSAQGDVELVTVNDHSETVRIWTDSRNSFE